MAEKKPAPDTKAQFSNAVYELGLKLIENYQNGACRDANKTLEAIIEIFKARGENLPSTYI